MAEINLLPNDLREKEEKEIESVRKKPKFFKVPMSKPKVEKVNSPLTVPKPSLLSRLFSAEIDPKMPKSVLEPEEKPLPITAKTSNKTLHIPKIKEEQMGLGVDFTKELESEKVAEKTQPAPESFAAKKMAKASNKFEWNEDLSFPKKEKGENKKLSIDLRTSNLKIEDKDKQAKLDVNLIPAELSKHPELELPKKLFGYGFVVVLFILVIVGGYLAITWYQFKITQEIKGIENQISKLNGEIRQYEQDKTKAVELQKRLVLTRQLLNDHIYWTKFFSFLEKYTISEVRYTNFSMVGKDRLVISAIGRDYKSAAKQLMVLQKAGDFIKSVKIDAASAQVDTKTLTFGGVGFNIDMEFQPNVFLKPIE